MNNSQLINFQLKNYRSYYGEQTAIFGKGEARAVTAIYGPNASGKTNIAQALKLMFFFMQNSNNAELKKIPYDPFLLKKTSSKEPSEFEIEFKHKGRHFIYGYSVNSERVLKEFLVEYASKTKRRKTIFDRTENKLNPSADKFGFGKRLVDRTRPSSLLITKAREDNNEYSNFVFEWLDCVNVLHGIENETMQWSVKYLRENPHLQQPVLDLLKNADLWIRDFDIEEAEIPSGFLDNIPLKDELKQQIISNQEKPFAIKTTHAVRDKNQKIVGEALFDLTNGESSGTRKFFEFAAPLVNTLALGKVLFIDEFEAHLHSEMTKFIVELFKSPANKKGAQLIVNTHDTGLMSPNGPLGRDEILFVEKNYSEESVITALSSKSIRNDEALEKRYRQGLYGAKPQINQEDNQ